MGLSFDPSIVSFKFVDLSLVLCGDSHLKRERERNRETERKNVLIACYNRWSADAGL